jgi:hypothetical protein
MSRSYFGISVLVGTLFLIILASSFSFAEYLTGFVWNQGTDFQNGTIAGSSLGNPNLDSQGNPAWEYDWVARGNDLYDPNPWYKATSTKMVWDSSWFGTSAHLWARGDDTLPLIPKGSLGLSAFSNANNIAGVPVERFINPTNSNIDLSVSGKMVLSWEFFSPSVYIPLYADVVLARRHSNTEYTTLFSGRFTKPHNNATSEWIEIPLDILTNLAVNDEILLSVRSTEVAINYSTGGTGISLYTDNLNYTLVPEPSNLVLLGMGAFGILALASRRQKQIV